MERVGETVEFGWLLMRLLGLAGFSVAVTAAFAPSDGRRVLVIVRRGSVELRREAERLADVASDLFLEAMKYRHLPA